MPKTPEPSTSAYMSACLRRQRKGLLGARRRWRWSADAVLDRLMGGYIALTSICAWATAPDGGLSFFVLYVWLIWAAVLFLPFCLFAGVVCAIVGALED